jgi:2,4-dienoyl-CoA reductase-like NADH-dependent reductase (Old Yellow Enzyme family)
MSILFEPLNLGDVQIKNRFVQSATFESMATERGEVTDSLIRRYRKLAKGEVGLCIPGYMYVHPLGRAMKYQTGLHDDGMIPSLKRFTDAVHEEGGTIAFQLVHAGRQTTKQLIGQTPLGPSAKGRDPTYFVKPAVMTEEQIQESIHAFGQAARRAVEAGADGIQLHAAHGYLISQFLSPYWNERDDAWGGSDKNRFRLLREITLQVKKVLPEGMPLIVKLNSRDYTPEEGITPALAATYARWLTELGVDGLEVSCGSVLYSFMNMCRGDVPVNHLAEAFPWFMRPLAKMTLKRMAGKYDLEEGYNLAATEQIKPSTNGVRVMVVGGMRRASHMEEVLSSGTADFISMSRPFIREPALVRRIREGKTEVASCESCNECWATIANNKPLRCANSQISA